jgi:predicted RND superfamily exporter protein
MMIVNPVIEEFPINSEEKENLRKEISNNPLVYKLLVSENFKYCLMIINPADGISDSKTIGSITGLIENLWGKDKVYITGMPYLRHEIQKKATQDLAILMPLAMLIMIIFLYISFREKRGVLLPVSVVVISTAISMGLMPLLGYQFSLIAVLIPILMISIANNYGVHIISKYQELNALKPDYSMEQIVHESLASLRKPIILTGLTTVVGVAGMIVHIMLPAKQMGIVSAIGITFSIILSLYFLPAILIGMKKGKIQKSFVAKRSSPIDKILKWAAKVSIQKSKLTIIIFVAVALVSAIGIFKLKVSINNEEMMPKSHSIRQATSIINSDFGGTKNVSVFFEGDIKDPALIKNMEHFETELKKNKQVSSVTSIATIIKIMSKALNDPDEIGYNKIPDSRDAIAQYLEFYNMSGDPQDFEQLVNFEYTQAVLNIQFKAIDINDFKIVTKEIKTLVSESPYAKFDAGLCLVEKDMATSIVNGQIYSLIIAFITIIILMWIIFRSLKIGLIGSIPLIFTLLCNFGIMGWFGIELDIATSLLSSIAIGIGVDYTIHLFWRLSLEMRTGKDLKSAIETTLKTTGRGISINAFSVIIGFSVLFLSGIVILKTFAFLIILSLLLCLLCALVLIPAICVYFNLTKSLMKIDGGSVKSSE